MSDATHLFVFTSEEGRMPEVWWGTEHAVRTWALLANEARRLPGLMRGPDEFIDVIRWAIARIEREGETGRA